MRVFSLLFLIWSSSDSFKSQWKRTNRIKFVAEMVATSVPMSRQIFTNTTSNRLRKAQLRLAEAQGLIPIGASEDSSINVDFQSTPSLSKVREIGWRVAEPAVSYDPVSASSKLFAQPVKWLIRNVQFLLPVALFVSEVILDVLTNKEEVNRLKRADELLNLISAQSPALIKAGQALASRSDLLPKEYLNSLQKLQDRCPAYPTKDAFELFEKELGRPFAEVLELEGTEPVAAASIGQVYKARLRSNGAKVAVKIQRPGCEDLIAVDLFILRWYASLVQRLLSLLKRDINLVGIIDDFGELIYREIDYRAEAVNAQRFAELYSTIPDVFVPKVYTDLSTSKVLVMEWVDGVRLNDREKLQEMGLDGSKFVDTLVQCSLRQLLENGFFHADPHSGNLLAMPSGKLCYLDFGMVSYVESSQRLSIIEAVVHMVNRDFASLANLYVRMGFIPVDVDTAPIVLALENALPDVLNAPVKELNFKNVIGKLGDIMYKFPFSLPPYYIAIIRCLGVLEGLAIQIDDNFRIINDAYPYIASRLLTDPSEELQNALRQLLFRDGKPRWDRLEDLLEQASSTSDYDFSAALDQGMTFLISDKGKSVREDMSKAIIEFTDELIFGTVDYGGLALQDSVSNLFATIPNNSPQGVVRPFPSSVQGPLQFADRVNTVIQMINTQGLSASFSNFLLQLSDSMNKYSVVANSTNPAEAAALDSASRLLKLVVKSSRKVGGESSSLSSNDASEKFNKLARRALRDPVSQTMIAEIISELGERVAGQTVQRILLGQPTPALLRAASI